jgi:hypothetical protein
MQREKPLPQDTGLRETFSALATSSGFASRACSADTYFPQASREEQPDHRGAR